jgi:N-methylhydantoinase B
VTFPPKGRDGGQPGAAGGVQLKNSGKKMRPKGFQVIPNGDRLLLHMPGGGGMGPPSERDVARVVRDVRDGLVSVGSARDFYKVAVSPEGTFDELETRMLRAEKP